MFIGHYVSGTLVVTLYLRLRCGHGRIMIRDVLKRKKEMNSGVSKLHTPLQVSYPKINDTSYK